MAVEIVIPRLGWNMDEGIFAGWLRRDGETVRAGDPLFSLEGEKATQEIEAIEGGTLRIDAARPAVGDRVPVGAVIGHILGKGEAASSVSSLPLADPHPAAARPPSPRGEGQDVLPSPLGEGGRRPGEGFGAVDTHHATGHRLRISPLARRLASELGVDASSLTGSGRTGRVRKADILAAASQPRRESGRSISVGPIRRAIAERMVESRNSTAPVTLTTTADATNLVSLRRQFQAFESNGEPVPSITDFLVKLTAFALRDHAALTARWRGDRLEVPQDIHIGIAVDTEPGLLVPVIRNVDRLGLRQIASTSRDLIARARSQALKLGEMQGAAFTITNLGMYGIETFTPIINPPECAILGLGRIERQPVMFEDRVVGRERMGLSLSFDHRIVDGAPAARFLQALVKLIENPGPSLMP